MNSKSRASRIWLLAFVVLLSTGCVSNAQRITELQPNTITPESKVGVVWLTPCAGKTSCKNGAEVSNMGEFVPDGAGGLLIYGAVMSAHEDVIKALDDITADSIVDENFLTPVSSALEAKGLNAAVEKSFNYSGTLPKKGKHSVMRLAKTLNELHPGSSTLYHAFGFDYKYDLSTIADELSASKLIVLEVQEFGIRRSFGPFGIPSNRPYGLGLVRAFMWDTATESVLYNNYGIASSYIGEGWRQPNDWTKVFAATDEALRLAIDRATAPLLTAINSQ